MKAFRNPYKYQGGWAWVAPLITAAAGLIQQRRAKKWATSPQSEAYQSVLGRVEAAKAAGLHPLAALGTPSSAGTPMQMTDFSSVGDQIQNAVGSYTQQRQWKQEREFQEAQVRDQRTQQMNNQMREDARLNADLAMTQKQMSWIDEQIRASQEESLRRSMAATPALRTAVTRPAGSAIPSQYVPVRTRTGEVIHIPNPDLYDLELPSTVGAGTLAVPELSEGGVLNSLKKAYHGVVGRTTDVLEAAHNFHKRSQRWLYRPPSR